MRKKQFPLKNGEKGTKRFTKQNIHMSILPACPHLHVSSRFLFLIFFREELIVVPPLYQ